MLLYQTGARRTWFCLVMLQICGLSLWYKSFPCRENAVYFAFLFRLAPCLVFAIFLYVLVSGRFCWRWIRQAFHCVCVWCDFVCACCSLWSLFAFLLLTSMAESLWCLLRTHCGLLGVLLIDVSAFTLCIDLQLCDTSVQWDCAPMLDQYLDDFHVL